MTVLILFLCSGPLLKIDTGAAYIPNPQKANKLGEDAYFIAKDGKSFGELNRCMISLSPASEIFCQSRYSLLGVGDGAGGWVLSGMDAGDGASQPVFCSLDVVQSGVADGVGGWALSGVDAGEYARLLMQMAQLFAEAKKLDPHPKQVGCRAVRAGTCGSSPPRQQHNEGRCSVLALRL